MQYFEKEYDCTGIDINKDSLVVAQRKLQKTKLQPGNMISFDLKQQYDIILCLFSSIGYVKTYENLQKTMNQFSNHLLKGGLVIIEPWFTLDSFKVGTVHTDTYKDENINIVRMNVSKRVRNLSILDMHYLIGKKGDKVEHFTDRHELGLFERKQTLECMTKAGMESQFFEDGLMRDRGLYIGVKK